MNTFLIHVITHALAARESERSERGASAVEYGLLVAGIAAVIVAGVFLFGGFMQDLFGTSCGTVADHVINAGDTC